MRTLGYLTPTLKYRKNSYSSHTDAATFHGDARGNETTFGAKGKFLKRAKILFTAITCT